MRKRKVPSGQEKARTWTWESNTNENFLALGIPETHLRIRVSLIWS